MVLGELLAFSPDRGMEIWKFAAQIPSELSAMVGTCQSEADRGDRRSLLYPSFTPATPTQLPRHASSTPMRLKTRTAYRNTPLGLTTPHRLRLRCAVANG